MVAPVTGSGQTRSKQSGQGWFRIVLLILIAVALFRWFGQTSSGPTEGSRAKTFTLPIVNGKRPSVSLDDYRGHPVVIEVFAEWCGACRKMAPRLAEIANAKRSKPAQFLGVAIDSTEAELQALRQSWGIPFDLALGNSEFSSNYRVTVLPTIILLDAEGKVARVTTGITSTATIDRWLLELGAPRL